MLNYTFGADPELFIYNSKTKKVAIVNKDVFVLVFFAITIVILCYYREIVNKKGQPYILLF